MTVDFELDGQRFIALNGGPSTSSPRRSRSSSTARPEEVDGYWEKLTAGGGEQGQCGWLKDRFGMSWQVPGGAASR